MLSEKPWKADAILRLLVSVLVCLFLGALAGAVIRCFTSPPKAGLALFLAAVAGAAVLFGGALVLLGRPWKMETFTRQFFGLLVCVYSGFFLTWGAMHVLGKAGDSENSIWKLVLAVLSIQGAGLVLIFRFVREHGIGWAEAFGFKREWKRAVLLGILATFVIILIVWALQWGFLRIMDYFRIESPEQTAVQVLREAESWTSRLVLGVCTILLVPPAEEMLFRGILYPAIKQTGYPRLALWGTSLAFAAVHFNLAIFVPLTVLALVLTWLYERTNNLLAPIAAHSVFNTLNLVMLYASPWLQKKMEIAFP
jgi:membrane protease YdiL (CAAX protease family)